MYSEIAKVCKEILAEPLIGKALDRPQEPGRLHFSQRLKRLRVKESTKKFKKNQKPVTFINNRLKGN